MGNEQNGQMCTDNQQCGCNKNPKVQSQKFMNNKMQQTAQTQTIIEQVDDTIESVLLAAEMSQDNTFKESTRNRTCDAAILSLNMLAVSCEELYEERDENSIILGQKQAYDQFEALKSKDIDTYNLIEPHRNFINAALNGQKNLRYKSNRVKTASKVLFEQHPQISNDAFAKIISNKQAFDDRQESFLNPDTNKELAAKHESALKEYGVNPKYNKNNGRKQNKQYQKPAQKDLYFTKSGQNSEFVDEGAVAQKKAEQKEMDAMLMGPGSFTDVYDNLLPNITYLNAVLKLSPQNSWAGYKEPICCRIIVPSKQERATRNNKDMVKIRLCDPIGATGEVPLNMLELNEKNIRKEETKHIKHKGKLGYESIAQQESTNITSMELDD